MYRAARAAGGIAACLALAACGVAAGGSTRLTWTGAPSFQGEGGNPGLSPAVPQPNQPERSPSGGATPSTPSPSPSTSTQDPSVVATRLAAPDAIAILPDNTALVGERTTGRIVRVQPQPGKPVVTVRTLPGLDTAGDGGLLDLAVSPNYDQDNLIFALVTTPTDNRVVDFTLTGPVTPVLTGIPKGTQGNRGRIAFGADSRLYVGTGDAGDPAAAAAVASLAGKVLRVTDVGAPVPDNPVPSSPVFSLGHHVVAGLCLLPGANRFLDVEPDATGRVEINAITAGADYGWKQRTTGTQGPISTLPNGQTATGGCATSNGILYVTAPDGQEVLSAPLSLKGAAVSVGSYSPLLAKRYGRLADIVAAPDGALWITTSNRDGSGTPTPDDERVLRIVPNGGAANTPV